MKTKQFIRRRLLPSLLTVLILAGACLPAVTLSVFAVDVPKSVTTTPTGYTEASDVVYKTFKNGSYSGVMNWGARGEDCVFLSPNAEAFYVGSYTYDTLSDLQGGTSQSNAASSALYKALQSMMKNEHSHIISYDATRPLYAYTDCVSNDSSRIVSFYTGEFYTSTWNSGNIWNREHMWPRSKCINQSKKEDSADIMMLRPESASANSSRGNKGYGEGSAFYDPGESSRGDCARVILYGYTRWGNTGYMWGASGVIENLEILLRWMEEDPVDTWEMGRNDAVESITGTRNVFVDYPEYAWLLFGREIPDDMVTPSGIAASGDTTPEKPETTPTIPGTEPDFEMTQPEPPPATEPDFEMTQPEPPPATEPDFEMTQPEPPPATEPDFEMTQPEPPPVSHPDTHPTTAPGTSPETSEEAETPALTDLDTDAEGSGGCTGMAEGAVVVLLSLSSLGILLTLPKARRED